MSSRRSLSSKSRMPSKKVQPKRRNVNVIGEMEVEKELPGIEEEKASSSKTITMNKKGEKCIDVSAINETVILRVNETLKAFKGNPTESMNALISQLIPALATAVSVAVSEVMKGIIKDLDAKLNCPPPPSPSTLRLKTTIANLTYENDKLQQYTRRESVRIAGIPVKEEETTQELEEKVLTIFKDTGADVELNDLAVVHRVGKQRNNTKPVLVKFVSRRKRREVMVKKKMLKEKSGYTSIYINDDLTPLRARLLGFVQRLDVVDTAWAVDGWILARKKLPVGHPAAKQQKAIAIETPDDLWDRLGVRLTSQDFVDLGLPHLADDDIDME